MFTGNNSKNSRKSSLGDQNTVSSYFVTNTSCGISFKVKVILPTRISISLGSPVERKNLHVQKETTYVTFCQQNLFRMGATLKLNFRDWSKKSFQIGSYP